MPDVATAVRLAHDALRPGGRLFVFDMRLVVKGSAWRRSVTRLQRSIYRVTAGFTGADVLAELRRRFAAVEPVVPAGDTNDRTILVSGTRAAAG